MGQFPSSRLEHFGINVVDLDLMERFYCNMFGFVVSDRGVRFNGTRIVFLTKSAADHHQFVLIESRPDCEGYNPINQISFAFADIDALRRCYSQLTASGNTDIMQINHGNAWSLYTHDPEGNPLELFADSPWHTPQPCRGDLDITRPTADILRETEELCRGRDGFMSREERTVLMEQKFASAATAEV